MFFRFFSSVLPNFSYIYEIYVHRTKLFRPEHDAEPDVLPAKQSMWICSKTTGHVEPRPYSVQVYIGLCLISKQNHILLVYYRYVIKLSVMWNKDYVLWRYTMAMLFNYQCCGTKTIYYIDIYCTGILCILWICVQTTGLATCIIYFFGL